MTSLIQFVVTIFGTWRHLSEEVHSNHRFAQRLLCELGDAGSQESKGYQKDQSVFFHSDWKVTGQ